jgi:predicted AlkP superfamily pyrophosphatase or phosphodiesterase
MRQLLLGRIVLRRSNLLLITLLTILVSGNFMIVDARTGPEIRLVLQITVDGLRGDLLDRYEKGFGEGGFRYLLKNGTVYTNAHYQHANTETIVGHTTLATGTFPSQHGMIGNVWFDREAKELAYNIEDADAPLLPTRDKVSKGENLDPAQKMSRTQGRSPRVILAPTFSDGLAAYYGGRSKIFGVSGKDRSAVSMAGHSGKAFWFSTDTGDFITSTYYYNAYPHWVRDWNAQRRAEKFAGNKWELTDDISTYLFGGQDDRPYEADLKGYGRVFPHPFGELGDKLFYTRIFVSPVNDQLLLNFSKDLLTNEKLGQDSIPDYLSISFSAVDAINHFFGPSSLENEEVVRQLDRTLADLFKFIDKTVGIKHTLIVFSADHGMAEMPEYMMELGFAAGRHDPDKIVAAANKVGKQFGIDGVVRFFFRPYLYLDEEKIAAAKLDKTVVDKAIESALTGYEGIALAVATSRLDVQKHGPLQKMVIRNNHESRSGDIYIIQDLYWFLFEKGPIAVMHGSLWLYDTHVPIIFVGPGIDAQIVNRLVHPVDVAPTIAVYLGISLPAALHGSPLKEVLH